MTRGVRNEPWPGVSLLTEGALVKGFFLLPVYQVVRNTWHSPSTIKTDIQIAARLPPLEGGSGFARKAFR